MTTARKSAPQTTGGQGASTPAPEIFAFPVSSGQQRLWVLERLFPGLPLFNFPVAVRMQGPLQAALLEQAVNQIVGRHEILRTSFHLQNLRLVAAVAPSLTLKLAMADLGSAPHANREVEALRWAAREAQSPFDLSRLPLLRVKLLRLSSTDHLFVLTAHHIIFDGWSLTVFFRELARIYERLRAGKAAVLPEPPIQYADFAVWQQQRLELLDKELAWWKKRLSGGLPLLELPTDRPRPAVQTWRGAVESLALPPALRAPLQELSQRQDATLFMTLLAAFQTLLHRYSGQEEILVGSPVAGRRLIETENVIGRVINTLVMRGDLSGNPTFRELLDRVRDMAVDAYAHEEVPFERLVEELQPEHSLSHSPLFQAMFALERAPLESVQWPELKLTTVALESGTAKFDLTLYVAESAGGLTARMEFNTDLFDRATIQRMLTHFKVLLGEIVADPGRRLSRLPLLTETERRQLFVDWNRIQTDYPREKTAHELFEAQVARSPDAVAVALDDRHLTYRELDQAANRLAHYLRKLGVQPDTLVGIFLDRSMEMAVGLLGILKAGGAYLPLDPTYPGERLEFMLGDSRAPLVLTQRSLCDALPQGNARFVCLDTEGKRIAKQSEEKPDVPVRPENLAYVIYTSGSTGRPTGVQVPHRALVNVLSSMRREPGLSGEDALLAVTTLSFDVAALEFFLPLIVGARVVLATRAESVDGAQLAGKIARSGVTVLQATPATARLLLDSGWRGNKALRIFYGGEALSRKLANKLLERCAELWNLYGPTETTIWSAAARIEPGNAPIVIGRPIANTEAYVLDRRLEPVPVGVPGELFIGGDGLARGYLNRPELTAGKFVRHPFQDDPAARLYRTGDRARWLSDGTIELLGRMDHQVKIHGFRVEPGEIEAALLQFPSVREAVVIAREDSSGDKRLVAYLTSYKQTTVSLNQLRRFLREKVPEYMAPSTFVVLEKLPLLPNGKVDRRALSHPHVQRATIESARLEPRAGLEQTIAAIWEGVLAIKNPDANDNFFDLGGRSLQAVRVQDQLSEAIGMDLPLLKLFEYPTIRSLAGFLEREKKQEPLAQKIQEWTRRRKSAIDWQKRKPFGARVKL